MLWWENGYELGYIVSVTVWKVASNSLPYVLAYCAHKCHKHCHERMSWSVFLNGFCVMNYVLVTNSLKMSFHAVMNLHGVYMASVSQSWVQKKAHWPTIFLFPHIQSQQHCLQLGIWVFNAVFIAYKCHLLSVRAITDQRESPVPLYLFLVLTRKKQ